MCVCVCVCVRAHLDVRFSSLDYRMVVTVVCLVCFSFVLDIFNYLVSYSFNHMGRRAGSNLS